MLHTFLQYIPDKQQYFFNKLKLHKFYDHMPIINHSLLKTVVNFFTSKKILKCH